MSQKLHKALAKRQKAAAQKGRLREFLTLAAVGELLTWHTEPVLQVFVSDGQGGATERRVTFAELLRMDGGGKAAMERIAALKAMLELIGSAPEDAVEDAGGDSGRVDERIVRILEMFNVKLMPPPPPETFKLSPSNGDPN